MEHFYSEHFRREQNRALHWRMSNGFSTSFRGDREQGAGTLCGALHAHTPSIEIGQQGGGGAGAPAPAAAWARERVRFSESPRQVENAAGDEFGSFRVLRHRAAAACL